MPDSASQRNPREQRLDALIAMYYQAAEQGQPLNQAEFLQQHPFFAEELREFFANVGEIEQVATPLGPPLDETKFADNLRTSSLKPGRVVRYFGDYEILEELGAGGMGVVYKARQTKLKKIVALKMIKVGQLAGDDEVRRFQAEARAAANLDHPGIVAVHEVVIYQGQHYYEMDYVGGGSLSQLHRDEPVAARRAAELVKQLAEAMQYAHGQGIVHRDLKPANVLLTTTGVPRITDFGLAKRLWSKDESAGVAMTETGQILGTAGYMSPEQASGKTRLVGPPADIYALGALLYALLTSRAPFVGESQADTILQVLQKEPVSPRILNPSIARDLETICLKCLEKEPHKRYGTAQLLADDLSRFLENRPVLARPVSGPERAWRWCRRNPWAALALLLLAILGVGSPSIAYQQYRLKVTTITQKEDIEKKAEQIANDAIVKEEAAKEILKQNEQIKGLFDDEREARGIAESESAAKSLTLYISDMNRMDALWREANLRTMRSLLARHVPGLGKTDLRDFEWYYWQRKCQHQAREFVHGREASLLALSPNREWLATAGPTVTPNHAIKIWNLATGKLEKTLLEGPDEIVSIGFSTEESQLVVVRQGNGAAANVLNWRTGEPGIPRTLRRAMAPKFPAEIGHFAVSPSGSRIAQSYRGRVYCQRMEDGQSLQIRLANDADIPRLRAKNHVIYSDSEGNYVEFHGDVAGTTRTRFAGRIEETSLDIYRFGLSRIWQLSDELAPPPEEDGGPVFSLEFSPTENLLAAGARHGELVLWDLSTGEELIKTQAHSDLIWDIAFSADGKQLATASKDGSIKLWEISSGKLLFTIEAHPDGVRAIEFTKQGMLVSGGNDHCVKIWSGLTGKAVATFQGHEQAVLDVAILADGETVLSTSRDGKVKEWPLRDPDQPIVVADQMPLTSLDLFDSGDFLAATGGLSNEVTVWELGTGQIKAALSGQREVAYHVRVAPDGKSVISGTWDGTFTTWDLASSKIIAQKKFPLLANLVGMPAAAIAPDSRRVAGACVDSKTRVFNLSSGEEIATLEGDVPVGRIQFLPNRLELLTLARVDEKSILRIWNAETGASVEDIAIGTSAGVSAFSEDGELLAWCEEFDSMSVQVNVWDRSAKEVKQRLELPAEFTYVQALAFSPDQRLVAAIASTKAAVKVIEPVDSALLVWEVSTGRQLHRFKEAGAAICFMPDGNSVAVAGNSGRVNIWDLDHGEKRQVLARPFGPAMSVVYAPSVTALKEPKLLVCSKSPPRAGLMSGQMMGQTFLALSDLHRQEQTMYRVFGLGNFKNVFQPLSNGTLSIRGSLSGLLDLDAEDAKRFGLVNPVVKSVDAYAPAANRVFVLAPNGTLLSAQADKTGPIKQVDGAVSRVADAKAMATTPNGSWVALAIGNNVQLWDGDKLELRHTLKGHEEIVGSLAFSRNGQILASAGKDRSIRLWNIGDGSHRATLLGHLKPITCLTFSERGNTVVSASYDGTIRLWDTATGEAKTTFSDHEGPVHWIDLSPEGDEIASAGEDGTIRLWRAPGASEMPQSLVSSPQENR